MRSEHEVREKLAETDSQVAETPIWKVSRIGILLTKRTVLRWVLGELGDVPRRT